MKIRLRILILLSVSICSCSEPHETIRIIGTWRGNQIYTYEETVTADSAQTLDDALGEIITSTEIVKNSLIFRFGKDSAWLTNTNTEVGFLLIADDENERDFLLVGDPTLSLTISKYTGDSLILDEQNAPVTLTLNDGQMGVSQKEIVKSSFILTKTTDHNNGYE